MLNVVALTFLAATKGKLSKGESTAPLQPETVEESDSAAELLATPQALLALVLLQVVTWRYLYDADGFFLRRPLRRWIQASAHRESYVRINHKRLGVAATSAVDYITFGSAVLLHHSLAAGLATLGWAYGSATLVRLALTFEIGEDVLHYGEMFYSASVPREKRTELCRELYPSVGLWVAIGCHHALGLLAGSFAFLHAAEWPAVQRLISLLLGLTLPGIATFLLMPFGDTGSRGFVGRLSLALTLSGVLVNAWGRFVVFVPLALSLSARIFADFGAVVGWAVAVPLFLFFLFSCVSMVAFAAEVPAAVRAQLASRTHEQHEDAAAADGAAGPGGVRAELPTEPPAPRQLALLRAASSFNLGLLPGGLSTRRLDLSPSPALVPTEHVSMAAASATTPPPLGDDANLTEEWFVPGVPPILTWAALGFGLLGYWFPFVVVPNLVYRYLPSLSKALWFFPDHVLVASIVGTAFAACDAVEVRLGPADPQRRSAGKHYAAFSCRGVGHKSSRFFGHAYYLLKHDLLGPRTHLYAYSFASIVMALVARAAAAPTREARVAGLRRGASAWVRFHRLFLLNYVLGWTSIQRIFDGLLQAVRPCLEADVDGGDSGDGGGGGGGDDGGEGLARAGGCATTFNGRLHIIVTRLYPLKRPLWVVSDFGSVDELLDVIRASCYWPWQLAWGPAVWLRGQYVADGGFVLKTPLPAPSSAATHPCMLGVIPDSGSLSATAQWTRGGQDKPGILVQMLMDQLRFSVPNFRVADIAADFAAGYEHAWQQHREHVSKGFFE